MDELFEHVEEGLRDPKSDSCHSIYVEVDDNQRAWLIAKTNLGIITTPLTAEDCQHLADVLEWASQHAPTYGGPMAALDKGETKETGQ